MMLNLDFLCRVWLAGIPQNITRRIRRLCHSPQFGKKSGLSCFCQQPARGIPFERSSILAEQRPASVRTGGLVMAGERCSAFFCVQTPKHHRYFMSDFLIFRRFLRLPYRSLSLRPELFIMGGAA